MALDLPATGSKMLENLPSDVMVRINEFLEHPDRIRLSSCSKPLQKLVFQDCTPLWRDIDFSEMEYSARNSLTDTMLSSLLVRVNAKTVTRSLNLHGCDKLEGTGLAPLISSETMETLDLGYDYGLDEDEVVRILRTMIPFKLFHVYLRDSNADKLQSTAPSVFTNFLWELRAARHENAREERLTCSACNMVVVDESRQFISQGCGVPSSCCGTCRNHFCRHGSCSTALTDCDFCGEASCDTCAQCRECSVCEETSCKTCCPVVYSCDACSKGFCQYCDESSGCTELCGDCNKAVCTECSSEQNDLMACCDACDEYYCGSCREMKFCTMCGQDKCEECTEFNFLDCCSSLVCEQCVVPRQCDECGKKYCRSETVEKCYTCKKTLCEDCAEVKKCGTCSKNFCVFCREVNLLSCCGELHCTWCVVPRQCAGCFKNFRKEHVEKCGSCDRLLCKQCRSNSCGTCHKSFCDDDCAFVDTCEQCESSYCEGCATVVRCPWCGVACCEKCRRQGGCCTMCNDKPSKKARLSS